MNFAIESFSKQLKQTRIDKNLSQHDLSKLSGVPQSHISKIESNQVDLRLSSFIALANALGLELALVPRIAMPAVRSLSRQLSNPDAPHHQILALVILNLRIPWMMMMINTKY